MNTSAHLGTGPVALPPSGSRAAAVLRGLGSAIAVLTIVIGVPVALRVFVGWPLPHELPAWSRLSSAITNGDIPDRFWIGSLAIAMWLVWAAFTASVLLEAIAQVRRRATAVRGPRLTQAGAARLVTAIVVLFAVIVTTRTRSASATAPVLQLPDRPVATAPAPSRLVDAPPVVAPAQGPVQPAPSWTIERNDTLWHVAELTLGDGERWPEIFALNAGRPQPNGGSLQEAWTIQPGWTLTLPADAHLPVAPAPPSTAPSVGPADDGTTWTLGPGDSLWSIAEHTLGNGTRWPEIWALNQGHPQPDGRLLTDPDVIQDGTTLTLPTPPHAPPTSGQPTSSPGSSPTPDGPTLSPAPSTSAPTPSTPPTSSAPTTPPPAAPRAAPSMSVPTPAPPTSETTPPISITPPATDPTPARPGTSNGNAPAPGSTAPVPQPAAAQPATSRPKPKSTDNHSSSIPFAELALGGLATAGAVLTIRRLRRAQQRNRADGESIRLPEAKLAREESRLRAGADTDGLEWLQLVLKTLGTGESTPTSPAQLVRLDGCAVDVVFPEPPGAAAPELWLETGDRVWSFDQDASDEQVVDVASHGQSPFSLLLPWGRSDSGEVLIDLEAPGVIWLTGEESARNAVLDGLLLSAAAQDGNGPVEVLCCGLDDPPNLPCVRTVPSLSTALQEVEQRREAAIRDLETIGASSPFEARCSQSFGAWSPLLVLASGGADGEDSTRLDELARLPHPCVAVVVAGEQARDCAGWTATVDADGTVTLDELGLTVSGHGLAPEAAATCTELIETALDTESRPAPDASAQTAPTRRPPVGDSKFMARILGTVDVVDAGGNPVNFPRSRAEELVVYLAVNGGPVSLRRLDEDLWPDAATATRNKALSEARSVLGDLAGSPLLSPVAGRHVELTGVTTDWQRLRELAAKALDRSYADGDAALERAVELIRGIPFESGRGRFNWSASIEQQVISDASDAAVAVAERRLDGNDLNGAEKAARAGLVVAPCDERCWRILLLAAHRNGDPTHVEQVATELHRTIEEYLEPYGTLQPETLEVLAEVRPRRRSS